MAWRAIFHPKGVLSNTIVIYKWYSSKVIHFLIKIFNLILHDFNLVLDM
jgi:hypothetical protein